MAENKTKATDSDVEQFVASLNEQRQGESLHLIELMKRASNESAVMWGTSIVGFGRYHYRYASGREGDWMKIGFSPRKAAISLYLSCDVEMFKDELAKIGKVTHGKGCVYIKSLENIDMSVLESMIEKAYALAGDYTASKKGE